MRLKDFQFFEIKHSGEMPKPKSCTEAMFFVVLLSIIAVVEITVNLFIWSVIFWCLARAIKMGFTN